MSLLSDVTSRLLPAIAARRSIHMFDADRPLTEDELAPLFEAARWAASSNNLQPWRFPWALRGDPTFAAILATLAQGNASWAHRAGALVIACAIPVRPDGAPNRHAAHDLGQALAQMAIQAASAGLGFHAIGGFDRDRARQALAIPADLEPYTAVAIGWPGDPGLLEDHHRRREDALRTRRSLAELALRGGWAR